MGNIERNIPEQEAEDNITVLLVEDDEAVAEMYRTRLELDGYTVIQAGDGVEALHKATDLRPDLIFLDLRLPVLDGFGVLEILRAQPQTAMIPVVIVSNYGEPELVEKGLKLGALDYLVKSKTTPGQLSSGVLSWANVEDAKPS